MDYKWSVQVEKCSFEINKNDFSANWYINLKNDYYVERSMQTFRVTPKEKSVFTPWFEGEIYNGEFIEVKGEFRIRKFEVLFNLLWLLFLVGLFIRAAMGWDHL